VGSATDCRFIGRTEFLLLILGRAAYGGLIQPVELDSIRKKSHELSGNRQFWAWRKRFSAEYKTGDIFGDTFLHFDGQNTIRVLDFRCCSPKTQKFSGSRSSGAFMNTSLYTPFAISEAINDLLHKSQVAGVNCQCAGTLVVLRGKVTSSKSKERAASIARRCCGMNEIANEIHVVG
jgi:hypothetical protein